LGESIRLNGTDWRFDARTVHLSLSVKDRYLFEETHWWLTQTERLANQRLDWLFGDKRTYEVDDWVALYRTNLNILGVPIVDDTQEYAVPSRLIYGLSAAYLIVGEWAWRGVPMIFTSVCLLFDISLPPFFRRNHDDRPTPLTTSSEINIRLSTEGNREYNSSGLRKMPTQGGSRYGHCAHIL
jgi:hypothetical protein